MALSIKDPFGGADTLEDSKKQLALLLMKRASAPNPSLGGSVLNGLAMGLMGLSERNDANARSEALGKAIDAMYGQPGMTPPGVSSLEPEKPKPIEPKVAVPSDALSSALMSDTPTQLSGGTLPAGGGLVDAVKKFEGFSPVAKPDYKQFSNGYGTKAAYAGEPIDRNTAEQRLRSELAVASDSVNKFAPDAPQGVKDALTSLTYNAGPGWQNSGLGQAVKAGDWQAAAERLQQYNKAGGQVLPGLVDRRAQEAAWMAGGGPGGGLAHFLGGPSAQAQSFAPTQVASVNPLAGIPPQQGIPQMPAGLMPPAQANVTNVPVRQANMPQMAPQPTQVAQAGGMPSSLPQAPQDPAVQQLLQLYRNATDPKVKAYFGSLLLQRGMQQPKLEYKTLNERLFQVDPTGRMAPRDVTPHISGFRPLVDPAEREKFGIPAEDRRPYQLDMNTGKLINPPPENRVTVDQRAPNEFEKTYGAEMGKRAISTVEAADKASISNQEINLMRGINKSISTGKLTPGFATIGAYLQSAGVDPKSIGIDPNLPARVESFTALANKQLMGQLGAGGFPTQQFSDTDRKFLQQINPSPSDRPEANELKFEVAQRLNNLKIEKAQRWADARENGTSYEKFERDWNRELRKRNIFGDLTANSPAAGGNNGGAPTLQDIENEILRRRGQR